MKSKIYFYIKMRIPRGDEKHEYQRRNKNLNLM